MQSKLKATQTMQVQNNVSPTRFTEHAPTQRHTIRCPAGITIFHTPSCLTCRSCFKKGSVSRPRQGTGQAPVDRIHSSVPQFESVHGLLDRQSTSLVRQQRRWNLSQNTTVSQLRQSCTFQLSIQYASQAYYSHTTVCLLVPQVRPFRPFLAEQKTLVPQVVLENSTYHAPRLHMSSNLFSPLC